MSDERIVAVASLVAPVLLDILVRWNRADEEAERLGIESKVVSLQANDLSTFDSHLKALTEQVSPELKSEIHLIDLMMEVVFSIPEESKGNFVLVCRDIAARLIDPVARYEFQVPFTIAAVNQLEIETRIGGEANLSIIKPTNDTDHRHTLTGSMNAVSRKQCSDSAIREASNLLALILSTEIANCWSVQLDVISKVRLRDMQGIAYEISPSSHSPADVMYFVDPDTADLSEIEVARIEKHGKEAFIDAVLQKISKVHTSNSDRCVELRSAANLIMEATLSTDPGKATALSLMAIEAILLESKAKDNISARLKEAVAYHVGESDENRKMLRKQIGDFYNIRSRYVHRGQASCSGEDKNASILLAQRIFKKELNTIVV